MPMLKAEKFDGILVLTLNRPEKLNALNNDLLKALVKSIHYASLDSSLSYLLLRGAGKAFSAGGDLHEACEKKSLKSQSFHAYLDRLIRNLNVVVELLQDLPLPTGALLHGSVAGGGFALSLAVDYRFATSDLRIRAGPALLGVIPAGGCTYFLPRLLGESLSRKLLLQNLEIEAEEALYLGIIDEIVSFEWLAENPQLLVNSLLNSEEKLQC
ncbi:MAG: enoyl-CoA hydratase/isomerase family protein [Candidatus Heimdallarchaeota archaeon]